MPNFDLGGGVGGGGCRAQLPGGASPPPGVLFWRGDWVLGYHSVGFGLFPDIF